MCIGDIMADKTNAIRLIEQAKIPYREVCYTYDESDLSGLHASEITGLPVEQVFKTLVTRGDRNGISVFCIPVCCELNLKKAAVISGNKKIEMLAVKDLLSVTGYLRGGCSPVGMKKKYPTYIDETCILWDEISVSAGARGHLLILNPMDLTQFVAAKLSDLT